jgi:hypothetical protein
VELHEPLGIGRERVWQQFDRDGLAQSKIVRAIHLAHSAAAEQANDSIPAFDNRSRFKAPVIDRA